MVLWRLAWVVMAILSACRCQLVPRVSFTAGSPGRSLSVFNSDDIRNTTTLLLSQDGETLFVGARDAVISLDVREPGVMEMKQKLDWFPSSKDLDDCSMKGKQTIDCHNFIRVLQFLNSTHVYACGTFAFSPRCTYFDSHAFASVNGPSRKPDAGRGRCPYDPYQRNTAIIVDGELYTGTVADYQGNRPVISRYLGEGNLVDLRLDDTLGWLEDPTFISSAYIPSEGKVYFFFSEEGKEYDYIEKITVPRVAQVCTSDEGGQLTLQKRWTTFAKAQLLCQAEGELPYNVLLDIVTLPPPEGATDDETRFYGIFGSQWASNSGKSAVCSFRLGDVKAVFSGNYKVLNRDTLRWSTRLKEKVANPGECGLHTASDSALRFVKENFLADENVSPAGGRPALVSPDQRYSRIAAQRTRGANGRDYTVLFLLTESGFLHKVVLLDEGPPHIIEEVQVFQQPQPMNSLLLSITKGVVFVGTSDGVVQVPVSNCSYYWSCAECVLSRDPFCAWDPVSKACAKVSSILSNASQDVEGKDAEKMCKVTTITPRGKIDQPRIPTDEQVLVPLNEVVTLLCPGTSRQASLHWEGPDGQLAPHLYLLGDDGTLRFLATPGTLGRYHCYSQEREYQQTLAVYAVRDAAGGGATMQAAAPTLPPGLPEGATAMKGAGLANTATPEPAADCRTAAPRATRNPVVPERPRLVPDLERRPEGRSYHQELVAVSIMLALALCALLAGALYGLRQRCGWRGAAQVCPGSEPEADGAPEHDPLTDNGTANAAGAKHNGLAQSGPQQGKPPPALENGSPRGFNGHLPNTPI
ncbi:semaphorin-4A-like [Anguilla rostrata]|uniref:semaphorin-4A-like n=1 Tax=Anguilla rostrata TaxID=7938 RepID=UPI0030CC7341